MKLWARSIFTSSPPCRTRKLFRSCKTQMKIYSFGENSLFGWNFLSAARRGATKEVHSSLLIAHCLHFTLLLNNFFVCVRLKNIFISSRSTERKQYCCASDIMQRYCMKEILWVERGENKFFCNLRERECFWIEKVYCWNFNSLKKYTERNCKLRCCVLFAGKIT